MNKTTDFLSLKVLSLADACIVGEVKAVLFDNSAKQAIYLTVFLDGKTMLLPYDKILCRADAIVIDSTLSLVDILDVDMTTLVELDGKNIYAQTGEFKGKALEVELFASGKTCKIITEQTNYTPGAFQKFGDILLLKATKKRTTRHTIPKDKTNRKVEIFDLAGDADLKKPTNQQSVPSKTNTTVQDNILPNKLVKQVQDNVLLFSHDAIEKIVGKEVVYIDTDERTPARIIGDYDFLLGRTLLRDLNTYAGVLIAKQGTIVTKEIVETASRYGKLVDLTLNSSYK